MDKFHILKFINNKILLVFVLFIFSCAEKPEVHVSKTIIFSGKLYKIDENEPFTGVVFNTYPNGKREYEGEYKHGVPNGLLIYWFNNGNKMREGKLRNGVPVGRWKEFNMDGSIKLQVDH